MYREENACDKRIIIIIIIKIIIIIIEGDLSISDTSNAPVEGSF
jgi:hypothetical protein